MHLDLQKANVAALLTLMLIGIIHYVILTRRIGSNKVDNGYGVRLFLVLISLALLDANGWTITKWLFALFSACYCVATFGKFVRTFAEKYTLDAAFELSTTFLLFTTATLLLQVAVHGKSTGFIHGINVVLLVIDAATLVMALMVTALSVRRYTTMSDIYVPTPAGKPPMF